MADQASGTEFIAATPDQCFSVAVDFDAYRQWAHELKEVAVLTRDDAGRAVDVAYRAAGFGQSTRYTLRYTSEGGPEVLSWVLVDGDITRVLDGNYTFTAEGSGTRATYYLTAELKLPMPPFIKRRIEHKIIHDALRGLKRRVESLVATGEV